MELLNQKPNFYGNKSQASSHLNNFLSVKMLIKKIIINIKYGINIEYNNNSLKKSFTVN